MAEVNDRAVELENKYAKYIEKDAEEEEEEEGAGEAAVDDE